MLNRLRAPDDDKIDVLGLVLALCTGLLLVWGLHLFCFECVYVHKYVYHHLRFRQLLLVRPEMLLALSPALNFLVLTLRGRYRGNSRSAWYTLAAVLIVIFSLVFIGLGSALFWPFYESLP